MGLKQKVWTISTVLTLVLSVCGWLIYKYIKPEEWAAWVQAVGSVAAIVFAIVLTWYQGEASIERERIKDSEEVRGLLLSIRDELCVNIKMAQQMVGDELERTEPGTAFYFNFPVQEDPFNIFNSVASRLPMIKDEILRLQIIRTYGIAKGAIGTFQQNNALVAQFESAWRIAQRSGQTEDDEDAKLVEAQLVKYGDGVRAHYAQVKLEIDTLLSLLRTQGL